jgi:hypothetical protein
LGVVGWWVFWRELLVRDGSQREGGLWTRR